LTNAVSALLGQHVPHVQSQVVSQAQTSESTSGEAFQVLLEPLLSGGVRKVMPQLPQDVSNEEKVENEVAIDQSQSVALVMTMFAQAPPEVCFGTSVDGALTPVQAPSEVAAPMGADGRIEHITSQFTNATGQDAESVQPAIGGNGSDRMALQVETDFAQASERVSDIPSPPVKADSSRGLGLSVLLGTVETVGDGALRDKPPMAEAGAGAGGPMGVAVRIPVKLMEQPTAFAVPSMAAQPFQVTPKSVFGKDAPQDEALAAVDRPSFGDVVTRQVAIDASPVENVDHSAAYKWLNWFTDVADDTEVPVGLDADGAGRIEAMVAAAAQPAPHAAPALATQSAVGIGSAAGSDLASSLIERVVKEVTLIKSANHDDVVIKLSPPDLGFLRIRVTQDASGISSHIQASSDQVKGLLQANLSVLADSLASAGIKVDSVQVTSGASFGAFMAGSGFTGEHYHPTGQQGKQSAYGRALTSESLIDPVPTTPRTLQAAGFSWLA